MFSKSVAVALVLSSVASAAPALNARQDPCQDAYNACIAAGTAQVACACTLTACLGEDNARNREYCSSATASLSKATPTPTFTPISGIPGGCNPAHPGSCPSSYFDTTKATPAPTFTPISGIPGGCNPAHPGSCPSSYFDTTKSPVAAPVATAAPGSNPVLVSPPKSWIVSDLIRYCAQDNSGCDYNFAITADGKTDRCTVIRMPGSNAATESWANQPCTAGSNFTISWGYVAQPAPAFAVITVVQGKELAWFGVSDVNGGKVSPSSPFGSGEFGTLPASPVYTY